MSAIAIHAEGLCKRYRLGSKQNYRALRDLMANAFTAPFRGKHGKPENLFWAVKDVSFSIQKGEAVGLIGSNGAGKSTLLKILSRIVDPTSGRALVRGRVGSLLEVGTGFHPELTGRENIFLNGAILGMKRAEISNRFDSIVEFAEMQRFIDTPVKFYSSGMYTRLAFAVAAHMEPDILLVDEVLAVGDAAFQKKCMGKMEDVARGGRTILFVSHNMGAIKALCSRAIWMESGRIAKDGAVESVISSYFDHTFTNERCVENTSHPDQFQINKVLIKDKNGNVSSDFLPGDPLTVEIHYSAPGNFVRPNFWIGIVSQFGSLFGANMLFDGHSPEQVSGRGTLSCMFASLPLIPQTYTIRVGVRGKDGFSQIAPTQEAGYFRIKGSMKELGFDGEFADSLSWGSSPILLPYTWRLPDGRIVAVDGVESRKQSVP